MPITAALVAPYTKRFETPLTLDAADDILTMEPRPCLSMPGRKARIVWYIDATFKSKEKRQASSSQSSMDPSCASPAQLNRTSTEPSSLARHRKRDEQGKNGTERL